ncbi:MAG: pilus assembly protein TadG-related protein, partial [Vicinamibacterales bacterium]
LARDESGMSYVFIGMGLMAFLSASMLAIDVGMLMTARSQAQNSADAGALAGATALLYDDYDDRSPTGPAVQNARQAATFNQVVGSNVSVKVEDVEFRADPTGEMNRVRVTVRRTASRGNPVSTLIASYFGVRTTDIGAVAMAEASPANAMTCVKPFTIPDRWIEGQTGLPSQPDDSFDYVDKKGNAVNPQDIYHGDADSDSYTGYNAERDKGMLITLKANNDTKIAPSFYYPWNMEGEDSGADDYRWNIGNCNTQIMGFGEIFEAEPGNMVGPTQQGMEDLIARDPNAYWGSNNEPVSSMKPSPRVVAIPLFDPIYYAEGKTQGRNASLKFVNYLGFFIERMQGNEVVGRITPIGGLRRGVGPAPKNAFPKAIRLVE